MALCTSNSPCGKGFCCDWLQGSPHYMTCSQTASICYSGDGLYGLGQKCAKNEECATNCCNIYTSVCTLTERGEKCLHNPFPRWIFFVLVSLSVALAASLLICLFCCIISRRRRRRLKVQQQRPKIHIIHKSSHSSCSRLNQIKSEPTVGKDSGRSMRMGKSVPYSDTVAEEQDTEEVVIQYSRKKSKQLKQPI